jgi:glycogen phosphorylase
MAIATGVVATSKKNASGLAEPFNRLMKLAKNLWWSWNPDAVRLFAAMDPQLFAATNQNPVKTLRQLSVERRNAIAEDEGFLARLARCEKELAEYLATKTWFEKTFAKKARGLRIAYFCAEFAVHESLPQYSGGLGVLAGDHLKSASDLGIPLVAVGLLYRCGYYTQAFRADGTTRVIYSDLDFADLPISDTGVKISVPMGKRTVTAKIWKQVVGRVNLFLMDTDIPENKSADRLLTHHLYGGDREYRIMQEMLLGVGGVRALDAVGETPSVVHMNEGHAAFATLERVRKLVDAGSSYQDAAESVRASSVFTTHTPVPAGNDRFEPKLAMKYLGQYGIDLGLSKEQLLGLGRENPSDKKEEFCMTVLALKLANHCNGVAKLHGEVSREMWKRVYGAQSADQVPIGHVTNGVHTQTWLAPEIRPMYAKYIKAGFVGVERIPAREFWEMRRVLRGKMIHFIRDRLQQQVLRQSGLIHEIIEAQNVLNENALTIGFARRFATYKRAPLIFRDAKRLAKILGNEDRPVQLVFAGKAHPKDLGGQEFAQEIYRHAHESAFRGRVVLLEDYDMQVGRMLTCGCDVWLNNPLRPQEASGTSGMKPPLHGGINCSILDGWWPECYDRVNGGNNGWAIGDGSQLADVEKQNRKDANAIYELLEQEIVPRFYERDEAGIPQAWVATMKHSMKAVGKMFNTDRMLEEYLRGFYLPAHGG